MNKQTSAKITKRIEEKQRRPGNTHAFWYVGVPDTFLCVYYNHTCSYDVENVSQETIFMNAFHI